MNTWTPSPDPALAIHEAEIKRLRNLNAARCLDYIDRICEVCGHTKGHDDAECPNCLKQAIAELNQRLIDRQESFQAQLIRIEDTWREKLRESQAQVLALREALEYALDPEYLQAISSSRTEDDADQSVVHCAHQMFRAAISTPPPPVVPMADVVPLVEAMDKIHHWHDSCYNPETQKDEGMVVSAEAVRELWEARADWHRKHDPAFPAKHTTP